MSNTPRVDAYVAQCQAEFLNSEPQEWTAELNKKHTDGLLILARDLEFELDAAKAAEQGIRSFHEASIKELYRMLGVDGSDGEIRFKWAALALSGKLRELEKAKAALAVIRPEGTLITDDEATRILRWHAAGDDAVNLQSPEDRALLEKLRGNR